MSFTSSKRDSRSPSQIWLPKHLSAWPGTRTPKSSTSILKYTRSTPQPRAGKSRSAQPQNFRSLQEKKSTSNAVKKVSLSDADDTTSSSSSGESERNVNSSQSILEEGTSGRNDGGSENVFNARSPRSSATGSQKIPESAALTEAQLQAKILRRSGHREFSSKAFDVSSGEEDDEEAAEDSDLKTMRREKGKNNVATGLNPVETEIARQQARYRAIMANRVKQNPGHYLQKGEDRVYELTSEEEPKSEGPSQTSDIRGSGRHRDGAAPSLPSCGNAADQPMTKKDKQRRKRKRENIGAEDQTTGRLEKLRKSSDELPNIQESARELTRKRTSKKELLATNSKLAKSLIALRQDGSDQSAKQDAEFSKTLKSFWGVLPKALLHATMVNLNRANRQSLEAKLQLCLKGKQSNPNVRVVNGVDEHGDKIYLLEEDGVISEPDPYTMSSELTLLTAAKNLILLLSGDKVGLDLPAIVNKALSGEVVGTPYLVKRSMYDGLVGMPSMEERLRRIASERQKEVEKLREENSALIAKLKALER